MTALNSSGGKVVAGHARRTSAEVDEGKAGLPLVGFAVRECPHREAVHLKLVGELDLATVATLQGEHERILARGFRHVVIDLRDLEFIDAAGLRLLLALTDQAKRDGWRLSMIQGPHAVRRLFELTNTLQALPFTLPLSETGS